MNKVENAGTTLYAKLMILSNEVVEEYTKIENLHKFDIADDSKPWLGNVTFTIRDGKAAEA